MSLRNRCVDTGTPRGLFGRNGLMAAPFKARQFMPYDRGSRLGAVAVP
jgi:hypothetical protein